MLFSLSLQKSKPMKGRLSRKVSARGPNLRHVLILLMRWVLHIPMVGTLPCQGTISVFFHDLLTNIDS